MAVMTKERQTELMLERDALVERIEAINKDISIAREQGDLSENAEYDAARTERASVQSQLERINKLLNEAEIVDNVVSDGKITLDSRILVKDLDTGVEREFTLKESGDTIVDKVIGLNSQLGSVIYNRFPGKFTVQCGKRYEVNKID